MKYKKGDLLLLSSGEYSDYDIHSVVRVLKDFDAREASIAYDGKKDDYDFEEEAFVNYLTQQGYVEDVEYQEWHLGSYGRLNIPESVSTKEEL